MFLVFLKEYKELVSAVLTALLTLGGAAAGAFFTRNKERQVERRRELISCYASFFQAYTEFAACQTQENEGRVVAALEVAQLLFPENTSQAFKDFERMFIRAPKDMKSRAKPLDELRKHAMDDILKF